MKICVETNTYGQEVILSYGDYPVLDENKRLQYVGEGNRTEINCKNFFSKNLTIQKLYNRLQGIVKIP